MVIHAWSRMLRLPNLLIIIFIQLLIYACFISPNFSNDEIVLTKIQSALFLISLLCVAASGYVINNIYDVHIDALDDKKKIIPNYFSIAFSWQLYSGFVLCGLIIAIYLSYTTGFYYSLLLYPLAVLSLWLYSYKLKCLPLFGNLLVALLTGSVIAIIPFIFWDNLHELQISDYNSWATLMYRFIMLFLFAVLSNLTREIIKDIEDLELDKSFDCHSTANYFGIKTSRFIALNVWLALLIICGSALWYVEGVYPLLWCALLIGLPALIIFILLIRAEEIKDYSKLSLYLKLYMIIGTLYWSIVA